MSITLLIFLLTLLVWLRMCTSLQDTEEGNPLPFPENIQDQNIRRKKAAEMLASMSSDMDPCEDFYEYACGNYAQTIGKKSAAEAEAEASMSNLLRNKINTELRELLEAKVRQEDDTNVRKVKEFYTSCVGALRNGLAQQTYFNEIIGANGGFPAVPGGNWKVNHPDYNWLHVVAQLRRRYGMDILVGVRVDINYQSRNENSIYLSEPSSTLIPRPQLCSAEGTRRVGIQSEEYESLQKTVSERLIQWLQLDAQAAKRLARNIVMFEFELCTVMRDDTYELDPLSKRDNYTRKTLSEYSHQFNDIIDFNHFVSTSFRQPVYKPVYMSQSAEQYFTKLIETIEHQSIASVANYIMYRALASLAFPLNDDSSKRPQHCTGLIKRIFPKILGELYFRQHRNPKASADVHEIYAKIKQAFEESLHNSWLEEGARRIAKQSLKESHLVFPSYENTPAINFHIERNNYWKNLDEALGQMQERELERLYANGAPARARTEIESYDQVLRYRPLQQQLDIGWGNLRAPFYESFYPYALKYATIGVKIARELSSAFDEDSWNSDRLAISNWDSFTAREYHNRSDCFRQELSNYLYNNPTQYDNSTQLRELIAASTGLNVAFNAYLTWLSYMSPNNDQAALIRETLPGIDLTNTQLFFVTFAQMNCQLSSRQESRKRILTFLPLLLHTPERHAVNGPLRNCPEFAKDFNCIPGSEMHPVDKCVIY